MTTVKVLLFGSTSSGLNDQTEQMITHFTSCILKKRGLSTFKLQIHVHDLDAPLERLGLSYDENYVQENAVKLLSSNYYPSLISYLIEQDYDFIVTVQDYLSNAVINDMLNFSESQPLTYRILRPSDALCDKFNHDKSAVWVVGPKPHEPKLKRKLREHGLQCVSCDGDDGAVSNIYRKIHSQASEILPAAEILDYTKLASNLSHTTSNFLQTIIRIALRQRAERIIVRRDFWYLLVNDIITDKKAEEYGQVKLPPSLAVQPDRNRAIKKLPQNIHFQYQPKAGNLLDIYNLEYIYYYYVAAQIVNSVYPL